MLLYHSITPDERNDAAEMTTPIGLFHQQMAILREDGYVVQSAGEMVDDLATERGVRPRTVVITFDDGFRDLYELAAPALASHSLPATAFVLSAALRREDEKIFGRGSAEYLKPEQVRELADAGLVTFGSHGDDHRPLDGQSVEETCAQLVRAKSEVEDVLARAATLFAYPFGVRAMWSLAPRSAAAAAGFRGAFTSVFGANDARADLFRLRRDRVSWRSTPRDFRRLLSGRYDWYAAVQRVQLGATDLVSWLRSR